MARTTVPSKRRFRGGLEFDDVFRPVDLSTRTAKQLADIEHDPYIQIQRRK
jgi:hypothetical protein